MKPAPRRRPLAAMLICTIGLAAVGGACTDDKRSGVGVTLPEATLVLPEGTAKPPKPQKP